MTGVLIRGDGVAARCCAHLLTRAGLAVSFQPTDRPRLPAIMLSQPAQALIREAFGDDSVFRGLPQISKRIVAWGPNANPVELDHSAVVVSEETLLNRLGHPEAHTSTAVETGWNIFASHPLPATAVEHRFGSRMASATYVELNTRAAACWIESVDNGWLFLIATAPGSGWLLSVGETPGGLLSQSRLVRKQIEACHPAAGQFAAAPRIISPLGEPGWIACGTAAMAFDPLCGDGTAHAVREAILASAVIRAAARGDDPVPLLAHYEARLTAGFQRHLAHSSQYYASGGNGPWWESESESVAQGMAWCAQRLSRHTAFQYRLEGFDLQSL